MPHHHGDLRNTLVTRGEIVIAESGLDALKLRRLAAAIGVSHTAVYRHFESKEALVAAIAKRGLERLRDALASARPDYAQSRGSVLGPAGMAYVRFALANRGAFRVMFSFDLRDAERYPDLAEASLGAFDAFFEQVQQAHSDRQVRSDTDPLLLANTAWALVHGLAELIIVGRIDAPNDEALESLVYDATRILHSGLGG